MAKKQAELPGTRLDSEPQPQKPIKALDEAIADLEKSEGKRTRVGQLITAAKATIQKLLIEHDLTTYEYETNAGVLKKKFRKEALGSCKVKVAKKSDDAIDDGDD